MRPKSLALLALLTAGLAQAVLAATPKESPRAAPTVVRRYKAGLRRLPPGPIVKIKDPDDDTIHEHVSLDAYKDLRNASLELMRRYPPSRHVYVGLGRDPAPFIAFLQEVGTQAYNFPSSGTGHSANEELDLHFRKLIPASVRRGNKTIVLIDQTRSGKTHKEMMPLFRDFLTRTKSKVQVKGVVFHSSATLRNGYDAAAQELDVIVTTDYPEVSKFLWSPYEGVVSPYERHEPSTEKLSDLKWRPEYTRFRRALGQRIRRDRELDAFLAKLQRSE